MLVPESERSLLLPLFELDSSMLLLLTPAPKSVNLWTSLPQDILLGDLSTGEGGRLLTSQGADRVGIAVHLGSAELAVNCFVLQEDNKNIITHDSDQTIPR